MSPLRIPKLPKRRLLTNEGVAVVAFLATLIIVIVWEAVK